MGKDNRGKDQEIFDPLIGSHHRQNRLQASALRCHNRTEVGFIRQLRQGTRGRIDRDDFGAIGSGPDSQIGA